MRAVALTLAFLLAGCDFLPKSNGDNGQSPSAGWGKARIVDDSEAQIGRFQFHPANGELPALVFDTATGCIEMLERFTLDDKPKEVVWIRKVADEVTNGTPKRCAEEKPSQVIRYNAQGNRLPESDGAGSTSSAAEEK